MSVKIQPRRAAAGRVAALSRSRNPDDPDLVAAKQNHAAAKIEDYIARVVAEAPPLSDVQRARLSALLAPTPSNGGGRAA